MQPSCFLVFIFRFQTDEELNYAKYMHRVGGERDTCIEGGGEGEKFYGIYMSVAR